MARDKLLNIFQYDDYRLFLRDYYDKRKAMDRRFSYRKFSKLAGFSSPNFYKLVADGMRNLSEESIVKFASVLELNKEEAAYFESLVHFDQSKDTASKQEYYKRLARTRGYRTIRKLEKEEFNYYNKWFYPVIREMALMEDFQEEPTWISKALGYQVTAAEARQAMQFLEENGFLLRDKKGRLAPSTKDISCLPKVKSVAIRQFHQVMAEKAKEAVDRIAPEERDFSSLTLPMNDDRYAQLMSDIQEFRRRMLEKYGSSDQSDMVCQFNLQLFKLAES